MRTARSAGSSGLTGSGIAWIATGGKVSLRRLESGDLEYLYRWENDPEVWRYGDCGANVSGLSGGQDTASGERFSREQLRGLIENQKHDISVTGQLRFVVCRRNGAGLWAAESTAAAMGDTAVGFVDLFDLNLVECSAGVGILICDPADRRKGYGREALELMVEYARRELGLRTLWCIIAPDNGASVSLFSGAGFVRRDGAGLCRNDARSDGELFFEKNLM